ncbi:hypothetical protein BCR37DRAFT_380282 [Protomyces lactucae-debilis]|uniref:N-acetylgalactosaminide beta-1,3-galactosyltransferase n=1 Tax=Protomyces lactucae-debilis TaxID=2754530 RepID=A0A1Y2FBW7_PROLT|nr:uncharacterized protein BCR37DRAFT_380282 [Protomyces lactucae-debilis]ORY81391.1 hypothetical protein BCR37DRAFT_380282 [Protomyces lactucae-debilis]
MNRPGLRFVFLCMLIIGWLIVLKLYQFNGRGYAINKDLQSPNDAPHASAEEATKALMQETAKLSHASSVVHSKSPPQEEASVVPERPESQGDKPSQENPDLAHQELTVDDIAVIVRTGWQVRDRINGSLSTYLKDRSPNTLAIFADREFVVPGYTIHDALKPFFERLSQHFGQSTQKKLYDKIQELDDGVLKTVPGEHNDGWKLDILKQPMSADLGYHMLSQKRSFKWWVIIDDDTYLHFPSIIPALAELDPAAKHFFGMPTGFDKVTYAQGGSGILLSDGAMEQLFGDREFADAMHIKGLEAVYGDYNLAAHLYERSIFLDQSLAFMFHEHPLADIKWAIRDTCAPLFSVHHMQPSAMRSFSELIRFHDRPLLLWDLLNEIGITDLAYKTNHSYSLAETDLLPSALGKMSSKEMEQSKGNRVNVVIIDHRHHAEFQPKMCQRLCQSGQIKAQCAAWTFIPETRECHLSDEIILNVGQPRNDDSITGILISVVAEHHHRKCPDS